MRAGRLRHRITFQSATEVADAHGEDVKTWNDQATRWASVEPLSAREQLANDQATGHITHKITIRNRPPDPINAAQQRILFGNRVFHINGPPITKNERGIETTLTCEEQCGVEP